MKNRLSFKPRVVRVFARALLILPVILWLQGVTIDLLNRHRPPTQFLHQASSVDTSMSTLFDSWAFAVPDSWPKRPLIGTMSKQIGTTVIIQKAGSQQEFVLLEGRSGWPVKVVYSRFSAYQNPRVSGQINRNSLPTATLCALCVAGTWLLTSCVISGYRLRHGLCLACGYPGTDVISKTRSKCPECGHVATDNQCICALRGMICWIK